MTIVIRTYRSRFKHTWAKEGENGKKVFPITPNWVSDGCVPVCSQTKATPPLTVQTGTSLPQLILSFLGFFVNTFLLKKRQ